MMTEAAVFERAIISAPRDNIAHLVYADWLEERGAAELAEFIRVQVALATPGHGDWGRLLRRERELWNAPALASRASPEPLGSPAIINIEQDLTRADRSPSRAVCVIRRGFVDEFRGPASLWVLNGDALCAMHPITSVLLSSVPEWGSASEAGRYICRLNDDPRRLAFSYWEAEARGREETRGQQNSVRTAVGILCLRWPGVGFDVPT